MDDWEKTKKEWFKDPEFRKALDQIEPEFEIALAIAKLRSEKKLSQKQLAEKLQTQQSVISRLEMGKTSPSLTFLKRLAKALDLSLQVRFV